MIVLRGINRPLSSCLFNVRAYTGIKSLSREHEDGVVLEGCSMLEKGGPRNALPMCARKEDREREDPEPTWISNGNTNQIGAR